jgi:hypothetical protein
MSIVKKIDALKMAKNIGCSGAHEDSKGNWMPCSSTEELEKISNAAEPSKKSLRDAKKFKKTRFITGKQKRRSIENFGDLEKDKDNEWEKLGKRGVISINATPGLGITSGKTLHTSERSKYKEIENEVKAMTGPEYVRDNDPDVFIDPESAKFRSRQLGCIGISRRISKTGRAVWMPCTNMSDYSRLAGTTALGRRGQRRNFENAVRTVVRDESRKLKRKVSIFEEIYGS